MTTDSLPVRWRALSAEILQATPKSSPPVRVIAVTKNQPIERIEEAMAAGLTEFGVNYVQPGEQLRHELMERAKLPALKWHFIGHIQSRKVRSLLGYDCIQSVDRIEIINELKKRGETSAGPLPKLLIEVNIGAESQKSGVSPTQLESFLAQLESAGLLASGLMAMPPPLFPVEERARYFDEMRALFDKLGPSRKWDTLSMGTSEDFLVAIRCGATMVRLGTVLLGERISRDA